MRRVKQPASLLSVRSARSGPVSEAAAKPGDLSHTLSVSEGHPIALRAKLDRAFSGDAEDEAPTASTPIEASPHDDAVVSSRAPAPKRGFFGTIFRGLRRHSEDQGKDGA